jgi:toxin CcdB
MRQFDVFPNPSEPGRKLRPYVVVLQGDHIEEQRTRIVAPLVLASHLTPTSRMTPVFEIEGQRLVLSVTELATFRVSVLKGPVANIGDRHDEIIRALDILFGGV